MGEKRELRRELDDTKELALVQTKRIDELERENEQLRSTALALPAGDGNEPYRLVTDPVDITVRAGIAKSLGIVIPPGGELLDSDILIAVERLRHDHTQEDMPSKPGESLAEAVAHNKAERSDLLDRLTNANLIVGRLAAALGVGQWSQDGVEIVEKAQRFSVFAHWLKRRHNDAMQRLDLAKTVVDQADGDEVAVLEREAVVAELRTIISALVAEKDLAKYIQTKATTVGKSVLDLAEHGAPARVDAPWLDRPFTVTDVKTLAGIGVTESSRPVQLLALLDAVTRSQVAMEDLVTFMNLVVLPTLRRLYTPPLAPITSVH